jgi:hypothetical protein
MGTLFLIFNTSSNHVKIVAQESATLGSGSHEKQIPIDADHRQMCKFGSDVDPAYDQVSKNLIDLIERATRLDNRKTSSTLVDSSMQAKAEGLQSKLEFQHGFLV